MVSVETTLESAPLTGPFLCIINPFSGTGRDRSFLNEPVPNHLTVDKIESKSGEHMIELARSARGKYQAVIAVGGDGTVNGIGKELVHSSTALGIVPMGSGNGIARHLGISQNPETAFDQMLRGKHRSIDTLRVNDAIAIGFAGIGFDGHVAKRLSEAKGRGFGNYIKITLEGFSTYENAVFEIDGNSVEAFSIIAANVNQFGNDALINPNAVDNDGQFELIQVSKPPLASFPSLASRLFLKTISESKFVDIKLREEIEIINTSGALLQIDGEPWGSPNKLKVNVESKSLNVLIP